MFTSGAPDPPANVIAICDVTSIKVSWKSKFNGGVNQTFRIHFVDSQTNISIHEDGINDMGENNFVKKTLNPDTWYDIFIEAYNVYGTTKSTETTNCTTKQSEFFLYVSPVFSYIKRCDTQFE